MRFFGALARLGLVVLLVVGLTVAPALPAQASSGDETAATSSQTDDQSLLELLLDWLVNTANGLRPDMDPNN